MEIDPSSSIPKKIKTQPVSRDSQMAKNTKAAPMRADSVSINPLAERLSTIEEKVLQTPDISEEKVAFIKAAIAAGEFHIHPKKIAASLIASVRESSIK